MTVPSFSVRVVPAKRPGKKRQGKEKERWHWEATTFGWPPNREPQEQWLRLPDRRLRRVREQSEKPILQESVYFPFLAPGQELRADIEIIPLRIFVLGALNWTIEWFNFGSKDAVLKLARRTELLIFDGVKKP